jgi:hypothetical protein
MKQLSKVFFSLAKDDEGYPDVSVESVWATQASLANEYVLDNVPFFIRDATIGDVVQTRNDEGVLWFEAVVCESKNSLIRAVFFNTDYVQRVESEIAKIGCQSEYSGDFKLLAINVPAEVDLARVQAYLSAEADLGVLDYEEPILRQ